MPDVKYECDCCGKQFTDETQVKLLIEIPDLAERLDPNSPVPFGTCPICGAFVYRLDDTLWLWTASLSLLQAVNVLRNYADATEQQWQEHRIPAVCDRLKALAGRLSGHDPYLDTVFRLIEKVSNPPKNLLELDLSDNDSA